MDINNVNQKTTFNNVNTIIFDIVGTLVDYVGTTNQEITRVFLSSGFGEERAQEVVNTWEKRQQSFQDKIIKGEVPFMLQDDIRRQVLSTVLDEQEISLTRDNFEHLVNVGRYFTPWPEAVRQLSELENLVKTVGLTNASLTQITEVCSRGALRWHVLLSTQLAQTYKPTPEAYQLPIDLLGIDPAHTLFISAHPWDLRAAATHGFLTVYLPREYTETPLPNDQFDLTLHSLDDLIAMFQRAN
ncbi:MULTISPECIES: HAD-IA family hydrolase [Virgibacillus]|uniref:(S)-2-haloacid dehalogenase 4A n=2 Tax=Virgibacillus TaxID=84406 RepID=A0A024Q8Q5_9BACI|nr:HAD-IA family hydrolase [Virgibacillus massiliensis]CDQ38580.1 (S)-2-haloacid dehalogenase 4A [Virgibacillus massiliensis]